MSSRANAPVFQLHPSATGAGLSPPTHVSHVPAVSASHGFTAANVAQLMPNPLPNTTQHHQPPPPPVLQSPMHGYHERADGGASHGRQRNSSFSRRRADPRSRSSVPPQLSQPLPQIHAASAEDLVSGARTAPVPDLQSGFKREGESSAYIEPHQKCKREDEYVGPSNSERDTGNHYYRSPDRVSQHGGTDCIKSMKQEQDEADPATAMPSPPRSTAP